MRCSRAADARPPAARSASAGACPADWKSCRFSVTSSATAASHSRSLASHGSARPARRSGARSRTSQPRARAPAAGLRPSRWSERMRVMNACRFGPSCFDRLLGSERAPSSGSCANSAGVIGCAAAQRDGDHPGRGQLDRDPTDARVLTQLGERRLLLVLDRLGDLALSLRVRLALKRRRQLAPRVFQKAAHVRSQLVPAPAAQRDGDRPARILEVVQVNPIAGRRPAARVLCRRLRSSVRLPVPTAPVANRLYPTVSISSPNAIASSRAPPGRRWPGADRPRPSRQSRAMPPRTRGGTRTQPALWPRRSDSIPQPAVAPCAA